MGKNLLLFRILYASLALSVLADVIFRFFAHSAQEHAALLQEIPGFCAFYGFIACILIIFVSKWLGQHFLQRDEDITIIGGVSAVMRERKEVRKRE